ncbi:EF-hand 1, calcium-binding site-containing protein [Tanacetum coccineum]
MSQQEFFQRQIRREKEERIGRCVRQITRSCKGMLRSKLEEIKAFNSSIRQDKLEKNKCFYCREKGHLIRTCPKRIMDDAEKFIHFNTYGILKGTDQGSWDDFWYLSKSSDKHLCSNLNLFCNIKEKFLVNNLEDQKKFLFTYGMGEDTKKDEMARYEEDVNPSEVHTFQEFVGFLNLIKNDDVEFGALAEILGLTRSDGEDIRKCYMVYLDVFTSYYKTARAPEVPANADEDSSLESYQWSFGKISAPLASQKGKEKIEHFGIKLEDEENCKEQQTAHYDEDQITCYRSRCRGLSNVAEELGVTVGLKHKKINVSNSRASKLMIIAWEHEHFSRLRVTAATLSGLSVPPDLLESTGGLFDNREFVNEAAVVKSVKVVAESLARHIHGQQGKNINIFADNSSLSVNPSYIRSWLDLMSRTPRAAPFLSKDNAFIMVLKKGLADHVVEVNLQHDVLDGMFTFYDATVSTLQIYQLVHAHEPIHALYIELEIELNY